MTMSSGHSAFWRRGGSARTRRRRESVSHGTIVRRARRQLSHRVTALSRAVHAGRAGWCSEYSLETMMENGYHLVPIAIAWQATRVGGVYEHG